MQKKQILQHLKQHGSITPIEALNFYGVFRLSAIIWELRKAGYDILTHSKKNRNNKGIHARYELKPCRIFTSADASSVSFYQYK